jgi:coenzyme PQQ precursor peptide PqqA
MIVRIRAGAHCGRMGSKRGGPRRLALRGQGGALGIVASLSRSSVMKWETPQATDFRFGMEITMYIAKR